MKHFLSALSIVALQGFSLFSQDMPAGQQQNWKSYIHLESGFMYPSGTIKESIAIRQNISSFFVNQSSDGQISSETSGFILGVRWEYFNTRFKSGISTGVRYTGYLSEISGYSASNADFFYLRYSMLNTDTKFARVKRITEINNFIGFPLELTVIPIQNKYFSLFGKGGAEISVINLNKKTDIHFQDKKMDVNENAILDNIGGSENNIYSILYASAGIKMGNPDRTNYLFEIFLPSFFLTKNNFTLVDVSHFQGFKFSVQFPLH